MILHRAGTLPADAWTLVQRRQRWKCCLVMVFMTTLPALPEARRTRTGIAHQAASPTSLPLRRRAAPVAASPAVHGSRPLVRRPCAACPEARPGTPGRPQPPAAGSPGRGGTACQVRSEASRRIGRKPQWMQRVRLSCTSFAHSIGGSGMTRRLTKAASAIPDGGATR